MRVVDIEDIGDYVRVVIVEILLVDDVPGVIGGDYFDESLRKSDHELLAVVGE